MRTRHEADAPPAFCHDVLLRKGLVAGGETGGIEQEEITRIAAIDHEHRVLASIIIHVGISDIEFQGRSGGMPHVIEHTDALCEKRLELLIVQLLGGKGGIVTEGLDIGAKQRIRKDRAGRVHIPEQQPLQIVVAPTHGMHHILHPTPILQGLAPGPGCSLVFLHFFEVISDLGCMHHRKSADGDGRNRIRSVRYQPVIRTRTAIGGDQGDGGCY